MKLEKFAASSMTEAMALIQKKFGPNAVIYSQSKTVNGIEVIAGLTMPNDMAVVQQPIEKKEIVSDLNELIQKFDHPRLISELEAIEKSNLIIKKLRQFKFTYDFCEDFAMQYASSCSKESILNNEIIIKILLSKIHIEETELINIKKICTLVGPTGIGKSTTIGKLAHRFALRFGTQKLGIISMDFKRIITKNQFHYFGKLLNIQVEYAQNMEELREAIEILDNKRLILIDTAGVNQNDNQQLAELFNRFNSQLPGISSYLVLPCNLQSDILDDVVNKFKMPNMAACIITKTDESQSLAPCLSVIMKNKLSIAYCCNGQNLAKNIYVPSRAQLLNAVFKGEKIDTCSDLPI